MTNDYGSPPHPAFAVQDAFVQLVVSTYKDAARLVSNVGEHSAIFAPLGPKPEKVETLNLPELVEIRLFPRGKRMAIYTAPQHTTTCIWYI